MVLGLSLIAFAELFFHVVAAAFLFTFLPRSHVPQLRFRAAFNRPESEDQALRRFIVTVEPKDDNITIFEEGNPAAGTVQPTGGKFLEKTRIPLPGGKGFLGIKNFEVGGTFVASAREFKILECDAYTEAFLRGT